VTKRRDIVREIAKAAKAAGLAWTLNHEGANHTIYSLDGLMIPVPRHNEIDNRMARTIHKEAAEKLGEGWWK
jgi:alpha-L-fucosidase